MVKKLICEKLYIPPSKILSYRPIKATMTHKLYVAHILYESNDENLNTFTFEIRINLNLKSKEIEIY